MKPTFNFNAFTNRQDSRPARQGSSQPQTDYSFQVSAPDFSGGGNNRRRLPSFHGISKEYFKNEARSNYVAEAAIFGLIVLTAAVPVIDGISGLAQFVYGIL